jgi:hypothetical protein
MSRVISITAILLVPGLVASPTWATMGVTIPTEVRRADLPQRISMATQALELPSAETGEALLDPSERAYVYVNTSLAGQSEMDVRREHLHEKHFRDGNAELSRMVACTLGIRRKDLRQVVFKHLGDQEYGLILREIHELGKGHTTTMWTKGTIEGIVKSRQPGDPLRKGLEEVLSLRETAAPSRTSVVPRDLVHAANEIIKTSSLRVQVLDPPSAPISYCIVRLAVNQEPQAETKIVNMPERRSRKQGLANSAGKENRIVIGVKPEDARSPSVLIDAVEGILMSLVADGHKVDSWMKTKQELFDQLSGSPPAKITTVLSKPPDHRNAIEFVRDILRAAGIRNDLSRSRPYNKRDYNSNFFTDAAVQLASRENHEAAMLVVRLGIFYHPIDINLRLILAECFAAQGDFDKAIQVVEVLVRQNPWNKDHKRLMGIYQTSRQSAQSS